MERSAAGVLAVVMTTFVWAAYRSGVLKTVWVVKRNNYEETRAKLKPQRAEKWSAWRAMVVAFVVAVLVFGFGGWLSLASASVN